MHLAHFSAISTKAFGAARLLMPALLLSAAPLMANTTPTPAKASADAAPKNIIFMIGDGMGPAYLTAYRFMQTEPGNTAIPNTIFDDLWLGMASTTPDDDTFVTDSAASATALATGIKSFNGAISVDSNHMPIGTMLQLAKRLGKATGVVASSQVNHATPAAFLAHNSSRRNMDAIADMYLDNHIHGKPVADIIFGGGREHFIREDRNLVAEFTKKGYQYAENWSEIEQLTGKPALALLAPSALPSALNNPHPSPLATLSEQALKLLTPSKKGFVLMIEGSLIDWCGHDNDIACAMAEMDDFAKAVAVAKAYVDAHADTLLIITADHETGGLSLGANNVYQWLPAVIRGVSATSRAIADELNAVSTEAEALQRWQALTGIVITEQEQQQLLAERNKTQADLRIVVNELISRYSHTGWTTGGHTAVDVPVLAYGKGKQQFSGFMDNTDIAKRLMQFILQTPE